MFVITSYIQPDNDEEEEKIPYKVFGTYNSKEDAVEDIHRFINFFLNNYPNNVIHVYDFDNGFTINFVYTMSDNECFKQYIGLYFEIKKIYTPSSISNLAPSNVGAIINKIYDGADISKLID